LRGDGHSFFVDTDARGDVERQSDYDNSFFGVCGEAARGMRVFERPTNCPRVAGSAAGSSVEG
jgi:hypothetical protein